jgi:two-component system, chemotaxis family, sensor kinase CheA
LRNLLNLQGNWGNSIKSIIVRNGSRIMALLCEKIIGEHQAVLKPLGKSFDNSMFISSASQLGDGNMAFMLDTAKLSNNLGHTSTI